MNAPDPFEAEEPASGEDEAAYEVPPAMAAATVMRLLSLHGDDRAQRLAAFHRQLSQRIASLDRGERADPAIVRQRIREKSHPREGLGA